MPPTDAIREWLDTLKYALNIGQYAALLDQMDLPDVTRSESRHGSDYKTLVDAIAELDTQLSGESWLTPEQISDFDKRIKALSEGCIIWMKAHEAEVLTSLERGRKTTSEINRYNAVNQAFRTLGLLREHIDEGRRYLVGCKEYGDGINEVRKVVAETGLPQTWDVLPPGFEDTSTAKTHFEKLHTKLKTLDAGSADLPIGYLTHFDLVRAMGFTQTLIRSCLAAIQVAEMVEAGDQMQLVSRAKMVLYRERESRRPFALGNPGLSLAERAFQQATALSDTEDAEATLRGNLDGLAKLDLTVLDDDAGESATRFARAINLCMAGLISAVQRLPPTIEDLCLEAIDGVHRHGPKTQTRALIRLLGQIWLVPVIDSATSRSRDPDGIDRLSDIVEEICRGRASESEALLSSCEPNVLATFKPQEEAWQKALAGLLTKLEERAEAWWRDARTIKTAPPDIQPLVGSLKGDDLARSLTFLMQFKADHSELWGKVTGDGSNLIDGLLADELEDRLTQNVTAETA